MSALVADPTEPTGPALVPPPLPPRRHFPPKEEEGIQCRDGNAGNVDHDVSPDTVESKSTPDGQSDWA